MNSSNLYDTNIERAVLSALLFDPTLLDEVMLKLRPEDFYLPFHKALYSAMLTLHKKNRPIDENFLVSILTKSEAYDEVAFLDVMAANAISNTNPYIELILEKARLRKLIFLGKNINKKVIEEDESSEELISYVSKQIETLDAQSVESEKSINEIADIFLEYMDEARENGKVVGIRTGIRELDRLDVILNPGDLCIIGARPSVGKTALATSWICNMINAGEKILFTSIDMDSNLLFMRIISTMSGETINDLKRGTVKDAKALHHAIIKLKKSLIIHNEKRVPWSKIKMKSKRAFRKEGVTVWFIDHIGKIAYREPQFRRFEVGEVTADAKAMGEELGVVPILLTQLNREVASRAGNKPNLSDLKESGSIEEDATHVILPHRESYFNKTKDEREADVTDAELIVAKNQTGPTGVAKCHYHSKYTKFSDEGFVVEHMDNDASKIDMPKILC